MNYACDIECKSGEIGELCKDYDGTAKMSIYVLPYSLQDFVGCDRVALWINILSPLGPHIHKYK